MTANPREWLSFWKAYGKGSPLSWVMRMFGIDTATVAGWRRSVVGFRDQEEAVREEWQLEPEAWEVDFGADLESWLLAWKETGSRQAATLATGVELPRVLHAIERCPPFARGAKWVLDSHVSGSEDRVIQVALSGNATVAQAVLKAYSPAWQSRLAVAVSGTIHHAPVTQQLVSAARDELAERFLKRLPAGDIVEGEVVS